MAMDRLFSTSAMLRPKVAGASISLFRS